MAKYIAFIIIIAFRLAYQPAVAQPDNAPFAGPSPLPTTTTIATPAKLINVNGSINGKKIVLNWVVDNNETADQFEVEKSTDGKNFTLAALVFGTDRSETGNYQFYEKAGNQKVSYRIKLIHKDHKEEYSTVIEINPKA